MDTIHLLMRFGLTHQEAKIYSCLHECRHATGYELAKAAGISRSNAYASLSSLVEKGGAYRIDGKPVRYEAVSISEFCENNIRNLQETKKQLETQMIQPNEHDDAYLTIRGNQNIRDKIYSMISQAQQRIYISMAASTLKEFLPVLQHCASARINIVLITDEAVALENMHIHIMPRQGNELHMICDSEAAMTGELDDSANCTCLYSLKKNLVDLLKSALRNEMKVIELSEVTR